MPEIKQYQGSATTSVNPSNTVRVNDQAVKQEVAKMGQFMQRNMQRAAKLEATELATQAEIKFKETQERLRSNWSPSNGETFLEAADEAYKNIASDALNESSTGMTKRMLEESMVRARGAMISDDMSYIVGEQAKEAGRLAGVEANTLANGVYDGADPKLAIKTHKETMTDLQVPAAMQDVVGREAENIIWFNHLRGRADRADKHNPSLQSIEKEIKSGKFDKDITPNQKNQLVELLQRQMKTNTAATASAGTMLLHDFSTLTQSGNALSIDVPAMEETLAAMNATEGNLLMKRKLRNAIEVSKSIQPIYQMTQQEASAWLQVQQQSFSNSSDPMAIEQGIMSQKLVAGYIDAINTRPLELLAQLSGLEYEPMSFDEEGLSAGLLRRQSEMLAAAERFGIPNVDLMNPFTLADQHKMATEFYSQPIEAQEVMLDEAAGAMNTVQLGHFATMLGQGDSWREAAIMNPRPGVWRRMSVGAGNLSQLDKSLATDLRAQVNAVLRTAVDFGPGEKKKLEDAVVTHYAGKYSQRNGNVDANEILADQSDVDASIQAVLGTKIDWNGYVSFIPAKSDGSFFSANEIKRLRNRITTDDLAAAGMYSMDSSGEPVPVSVDTFRSADLNLTPAGLVMTIDYAADGSFGRTVKDPDGGDLIVNFEVLEQIMNNRNASLGDRLDHRGNFLTVGSPFAPGQTPK